MSLIESLVINSENDIQKFISALSKNWNPIEIDNKKLKEMINILNLPVTVILEELYVDRVYRDTYYNYFSSKHFTVNKDSKRISFFNGNDVVEEDFYSPAGRKKLQERFIGKVVLNPIYPGNVGRTYLDPKKLKIQKHFSRTTEFSFSINGAVLKINSFPFSSQNAETMTCAETTIFNLLEYYGTRYSDYKRLNPSDITEILSKHSVERVIPSVGLNYTQNSQVLKEAGFSSKIYYRYKSTSSEEEIFPKDEFKRIFHYYVESGIPFVVGIKGTNTNSDTNENSIRGHAVICIGHSKKHDTPEVITKKNLFLINTADFYKEYVIMDDNSIPFSILNFDKISNSFNEAKVKYIIVPLYKRIFLEAQDASTIAMNIITDKKYGIKESFKKRFNDNTETNPLVFRLFLTSSRSYKNFRAINSGNIIISKLYAHLPLPKFIWICELSTKELYNENKIFGEIIIDATSSRFANKNSIISMRYPGHFGYREPEEKNDIVFERLQLYYKGLDISYPLYKSNLIEGGTIDE